MGGSYYGFPDISGFYDMLYGTAGVDFQTLTCMFYGGTSGIQPNGNPPYTVTDFIQIYPKFVGPPTPLTGLVLTAGSPIVTNLTDDQIVGIQVGQLAVNLNSAPKDTLVIAVDPTGLTLTLSVAPTQNDTTLTIYETPFMPIIVIKTYVLLALASVMNTRYFQSWPMMMALFIAHYSTLYMRTESGVPNITAQQVAVSGLTKGIIVSRSAGDVSARSELSNMSTYDEFGAWGETQYGELFITVARATNMGPIWVP